MSKKSMPRRHYIPEWAEFRGYESQAALVKALNDDGVPVDKGTVSRWYDRANPRTDYLSALQALFGLEDYRDLYRSPYDDWMSRFLRDRSKEELERIKQSLELHFPKAS